MAGDAGAAGELMMGQYSSVSYQLIRVWQDPYL
jgi:hypothetical protein